MSYQVIARKWRPQTFEEVTGQESITHTLQNSIKMSRLHHAFIFSGPRGCGKTTTARILAKALNCHQQITPNPCGKCDSCLEISGGGSIDVLEIDAASNTGVDNVRDVIINTVAINPARDRYKIFIIDEVHMLSISAFNALLKTLEEPPSHIVFILATTELHKLPQTILSRCQHFEFRTIAAEAISERLRLIANAEKITINDDALMMVAFAGQGSMRDAQSAFDQVISFAGSEIKEEDVQNALGIINQQILKDFTLAIADCDQPKLIYLTAKLAETGYDLRQFCRDLMVHFRNLVMLKTVGYDKEIVSILTSEMSSYQEQAGRFSNEDLIRFFHLLTSLEQEIKLSTQPKFHLEIGLLKLAQLSRVQSLEEIISWLKSIEEKLGEGVAIAPVEKKKTPSLPSQIPTTPQAEINKITETNREPNIKLVTKIEDKVIPFVTPTKPPQKLEPVFQEVPSTSLPNNVFENEEEEEKEIDALPTKDTVELIKNELEKQRKWMLLTALAQGKVEIQGSILKAHFDEKAKVYYQTLSNKENKQALVDAAKVVLGKELRLDIKLENIAKEENLAELEKTKLLKQAENDPIVQSFVKTFKGEIAEVKEEKKK